MEKQANRDPQALQEFQVSRVLVDQEVQMVDGVLLGHLVCLDPRGPKEALVQMALQENWASQVHKVVLEIEVHQDFLAQRVLLVVVAQVDLKERGVILENPAKKVLLALKV